MTSAGADGQGEPLLTVYTDGSSKGNPGAAGWCWWISDQCWQAGGLELATNNVAELTAVERALHSLAALPAVPLLVVTDSRYVLDTMTRYIYAYRRNGWRTARGSAVANSQLIASIEHLASARQSLSWRWQRGHVGAFGNTQADAGASMAAVVAGRGKPAVAGPGFSKELALASCRRHNQVH